MNKIPISGGPHSGKTTLLEALKKEFPDAYFIPEAATEVINHELFLESQDSSHTPRTPWTDYAKFAPLALTKTLALESGIPDSATLVFQDRGLIDVVAYARLNKVEEVISRAKQLIPNAGYTFALFCEPVGDYTATDIRRETAEEARLTHNFLVEAYDQSGIPVIHLPAVSVPERIAMIRDAIHR